MEFEIGPTIKEENLCGAETDKIRSLKESTPSTPHNRIGYITRLMLSTTLVEYFHVVFTLPEHLSLLALQNKRVIYDLLFRATSETLLEIAADPKRLGAGIGFFCVLHTWGQTLQHHPHLHCVVPGGGLSADHTQWVVCRKGFFLPVKVLSRLFRGKFIAYLSKAREDNQLTYAGQLSRLAEIDEFNSWLRELWQVEWVVYAKPPFGGPEQVLKYLARYTHRVAISN